MIDQVEEMIQAVLDSNIIGQSAEMIKRMVEELEARGFTREEAITIAANFKPVGN